MKTNLDVQESWIRAFALCPKNSFGSMARSARLRHSIGVCELAELLCCSPSYISDVERNRKPPYTHIRIAVLEAVYEEGLAVLHIARVRWEMNK